MRKVHKEYCSLIFNSELECIHCFLNSEEYLVIQNPEVLHSYDKLQNSFPQDNKDTESGHVLNVTWWRWHKNIAQVSEPLIKSTQLSLHDSILCYKKPNQTQIIV